MIIIIPFDSLANCTDDKRTLHIRYYKCWQIFIIRTARFLIPSSNTTLLQVDLALNLSRELIFAVYSNISRNYSFFQLFVYRSEKNRLYVDPFRCTLD